MGKSRGLSYAKRQERRNAERESWIFSVPVKRYRPIRCLDPLPGCAGKSACGCPCTALCAGESVLAPPISLLCIVYAGDDCVLLVDSSSEKFLLSPHGRLSVIDAITQGVKTDEGGGAFEARDWAVAQSMLTTMVDTVETAQQAGWSPPAGLDKAVVKSKAAQWILSEVCAGHEITLCGVQDNLYVHADGHVLARMRPTSVCRTSAVNVPWIYSVHPDHGQVAHARPVGIRSAGPWQVRQDAKAAGGYWPVFSALSYSGCTGMRQVGHLLVAWEKA